MPLARSRRAIRRPAPDLVPRGSVDAHGRSIITVMVDTDVLIAGAGPIGLTAAIEFARRGVDFRIVDPITDPPQYAKAVGVHPRTLEVFEGMGVLNRILDAATEMFGQFVYVNGEQAARVEFATPADVPFGFIAIPQYATERILARGERVAGRMRARRCRSNACSPSAPTATAPCATGLTFDGVVSRAVHARRRRVDGRYRAACRPADGVTDDLCRHPRPSAADGMLCPHRIRGRPRAAAAPHPGGAGPAVARTHRRPKSRGGPRCFGSVTASSTHTAAAGCSSRAMPPTSTPTGSWAGGTCRLQGMNTGIQDAHNLAWKLALALSGDAAPGFWTVTTPSDGLSARRSSGGRYAVRAKASAPTRPIRIS